jgi:hypothetical protein
VRNFQSNIVIQSTTSANFLNTKNLNPHWGISFKCRPKSWCIFKINGGGGGEHHGEDLYGELREQEWPDDEIIGGSFIGGQRERRKKSRTKKGALIEPI